MDSNKVDEIEKNPVDWLTPIEHHFDAKGSGGQDFYYIIQTILDEKRLTFKKILENAAVGCGCVVHEGLYYSLDQDWEDPRLFDEVVFFLGDYESSTLAIKDYFYLLQIAIDGYIPTSPEDKEDILKNFNIALERYRHLL